MIIREKKAFRRGVICGVIGAGLFSAGLFVLVYLMVLVSRA